MRVKQIITKEYKGTFIIDDLMIMYKVTSFIQA